MTDMTKDNYEAKARKHGIPEYMIGGVVGHVFNGTPTGDFLTAVFSNNLMEAAVRADDTNLAKLPAYCRFMYNECEPKCYGSPANVKRWRERGGQEGILQGN